MAKLTLEEKRLQQIRMQLFGKETKTSKNGAHPSRVQTVVDTQDKSPIVSSSSSNSSNLGEARFLKQDISKVIILSGIAIGGQFLLHYLSLQGIVNLNVFHLF
jgi:hypothetical protein